jgi:hypothetical protein
MPPWTARLARAGYTPLRGKFRPMPRGETIAHDQIGRAKLWTSPFHVANTVTH